MAAATKRPLITAADRFSLTFCLAIMVHGIIVLGITFAPEEIPEPRYRTMQMTLVQQQSKVAPKDATILAQANLEGGGSSDDDDDIPTALSVPPIPNNQPDIIASPPPVDPQAPTESTADAPDIIAKPEPSEVLEEIAVESDTVDTRLAEEIDARDQEAKPTEELAEQQEPEENADKKQIPETPPVPPTPSAMALMANRLKMAALKAQIDKKMKALAKRKKRKYISANTKESKYAKYVESWKDKNNKVGNLNYPDAAREKRLSGILILDVAVNSDGSIEKITIRSPSDHKVLDDAAIRIVELAAPYAPLPDNIREDVDVLHITSAWHFSNDGFQN